MSSSFVVEVKQSVISETTLGMDDIDAISNLSVQIGEFEDRNVMEFTSQEDAESWIESMHEEHKSLRKGRLQLRTAYEETVDAYMLFMPSYGTA